MNVTAITPVDKRRSKVLLDEDFALVLYRGEIKRYHIEEGSDLSEEDFREIIETILCKRARERMIYLLKGSDKTEGELRGKLREGLYPEEAIEGAISFGKKNRYIDDSNYVRRYLECYGNKKSFKQIRYDLQQKGISRETISELMEDYPIEEELLVKKFLEKKRYQKEECSPQEKKKLMNALCRKGFSYGVIERAMGEYCSNSGEI